MDLKIHQRKSDKNNTELYKKAVEFFASELLSKANQELLKLSITFKKFRGAIKLEHGSTGQISRYNYKMDINNYYPFHSIISTIAHEMVHIKQGVKGNLKYRTNGLMWKNELHDVDTIDEEEYNKKEWEAEARILEISLTEKFFKTIILPEVKTINDA